MRRCRGDGELARRAGLKVRAMIAYHRPTTLAEALSIRAGEDVAILAGGTDLYPARAAREGWGDMRHRDVLDISAVAGLRGIVERGDHWRIGALTTWSDLIGARLPPAFDGCKLAAREIGGPQIQNRGTLAGNICTASAAGDGAPNLLVLDAGVELASRHGRRRVPVATFIDGYRHTQCRADEIVTALCVPKPAPATRAHFRKLGARKYLVISIAMVAAAIEWDAGGGILAARLAVGACSVVARRLPALEAMLVGQPMEAACELVADRHFAHLAPIDDIRGSADYRRHAALILTRDVLTELARQVRGG
jgi:xanthine dehydrogenase small subunit